MEKAHESLTEYHKYAANANGYTYADAVQKVERSAKPYFAVLATWSAATRGAGAGWHGWTDLRYKEEAENPLGDLGIHTINEAFSNVQVRNSAGGPLAAPYVAPSRVAVC